MKRNSIWRVLIAGSAIAALSCDTSRIAGPIDTESSTVSSAPLLEPITAKAVACPTNESSSTTSEVGPLGGLLSIDGTSVNIPAGALLSPVTVTLTVPASNHVEIDVSVAGTENFIFELPIVVTVSYARCSRSNINLTPLSAWHFDQATGELLERMPSVDNKLLRTVTFTTGHLSGYLLAN
jgi:archaellum component FlaG (FlaF/FlaG flagellin family)